MIAVIDYGAGNLFSVKNALDYIGEDNVITKDINEIKKADGLILPGVGAFPSAMKMLSETGLIDIIKNETERKPLLGICLGMQMLFEVGFEFEETKGLGLIDGTVEKMVVDDLNIPHMGWNKLEILNDCSLLNNLPKEAYVYFVHSFVANCKDEYISAYCEYGGKIPALVFNKNVYGAQFHPEKSGETGLQILKNFGGMLK